MSAMHQDIRMLDRWSTRRARLAELWRREGVRGLYRTLQQRGLTGSVLLAKEKLRYQLCSAFERSWDRRHRVDTSGQIDVTKLEVIGGNKYLGHPAVSTSPRVFRYMSRYFPRDRAKYTFIDVGCGKGRLVLLASQLGFRRVIGVDFCPLITNVAKSNLVRFSGAGTNIDRCSIVAADATEYGLPNEPLVIYLNNPFEAELAQKFFANVVARFERSRNPIRVCISGSVPEPVNDTAQLLKSSGRFRCMASGMSPYFLDTYLPYIFWVFDLV